MESDITEEGKDSVNITVSKKGCIRSNFDGDDLHSSYFVLKDVLEILLKEGSLPLVMVKYELGEVVGWTPRPGPNPGFVSGVHGWRGCLVRRRICQR